MTYRRRDSPLHATRAAVGLAWCLALAIGALVQSNPVMLGGEAVAVGATGLAAGVWTELRRALPLAAALALTVAAVNALVTRNGLTVIWRLGDLPFVGQTDVTLEATVYGLVLGLRAAILVLSAVLLSVAVDPDELLALMRRWSFRSALTASVATRMVPVLLRDSRRLADAQRCRPGRPPGRVQLLRATTAGVFDRALDVAAVLEVRGYASARRPRRGMSRPWSRHDLAFSASAVAVIALAVVARGTFSAYPALEIRAGAGLYACAGGLAAAALAPFLDRRGVAP